MTKPGKPLSAWQEAQRKYRLRYSVEEWHKPKVIGKIDEMTQSLIGKERYTDALFVVSILQDDKDRPTSVTVLDSISGIPSKEMLEYIRDRINHLLVCKMYGSQDQTM